jgi:hypothetical protein
MAPRLLSPSHRRRKRARVRGLGPNMKVGDKVEKISGYKWPGVIAAVFETTKGQTRIVVECTVPEVEGALHIYSPEQVRIIQ